MQLLALTLDLIVIILFNLTRPYIPQHDMHKIKQMMEHTAHHPHLFASLCCVLGGCWKPVVSGPEFLEKSTRPIKFYLKQIWNTCGMFYQKWLVSDFLGSSGSEVKPIWSIAKSKEKARLPHKNSTTKSRIVWTALQRIGNVWWDDHVLVGATKFRFKVSACSN